MVKLITKQINKSLNEKYSQPEKWILLMLLVYLLIPDTKADMAHSQLVVISHYIKVVVSMVIMRNFFNHIGTALDELEVKQPKHWVLNKSLFKPKTTNKAVVNMCTIAVIIIFIIILLTEVTGLESPLLIGFAAEFFSKWILYHIYQKLTGD